MKGFRFYAEMLDHRRSKSASKKHSAFTRATLAKGAANSLYCNCLALTPDLEGATVAVEMRNSPHIVWGGASRDYLRTRCVRVSEALARRLHPALFNYLKD